MKRLLVKVDIESLRLVKANENDYYFHLGGLDESRVALHNAKMQKMSGEILPIRVAPWIKIHL